MDFFLAPVSKVLSHPAPLSDRCASNAADSYGLILSNKQSVLGLAYDLIDCFSKRN